MSAYSIIPPGATTYRAGMVNVQLGSPLKAARLHAAALLDGTQFVGDLPAQAESVRNFASRVDQARERKPVASLRLQAVVRRLLRDDDQRSAEAAYVVRGGLDRAEVDVAVGAPSPPVEHEDERAPTQRLARRERPAVAVTQLESGGLLPGVHGPIGQSGKPFQSPLSNQRHFRRGLGETLGFQGVQFVLE